MVRNKPAPQQLNEAQQRRAQWNLLDGPGPVNNEQARDNEDVHNHAPNPPQREFGHNDLALLINDELIDDDEEDEDFVPDPIGDAALRNHGFFMGQYMPEEVVIDDDEGEEEDNNDLFVIGEVNNARQRQRRRNREPKDGLNYGSFNHVLNDCQFYAKVSKKNTGKETVRRSEDVRFCHFGIMKLRLKGGVKYEEILQIPSPEFWVYVSVECDKSAIYFEWNSDESTGKAKQRKKANAFRYFMIDGLLDIDLWEGVSKQRYFDLELSDFDDVMSEMTLNIYFKKAGLTNLKYASDSVQCSDALGKVISHFFNILPFSFTGEMKLKHDTEVLYKAVKEYHNNIEYVDLDVQHSSLIPQLRPYQKAAVRWMLHQENYGGDKQKDEGELHCLFTDIKCEDGTELYYNRYGGFIVKDKPLAVAPSPGGILADEMGLGKTVEVLSCILNHPRKEVPKPEYQEPVRVEQSRKRKSAKKDVAGDVYTLHQEENEDEDNAIDSKSHIELSCNKSPSEEKEETPAKRGKGRAARKRQSHIKVHIPKKVKEEEEDQEEEETSRSGRPKRRAARSTGAYADYDVDSEDEDDYKPPEKKLVSTKSPSMKKAPAYNPEQEISEDTHWSSIESVIINECWEGKAKEYKKEGSYKDFRKYLKMKKKDPYHMMSLKERLQAQYKNSIAEYSAVGFVSKRAIQGFFDLKVEQKSYFECICGSTTAENRDEKFRVQCSVCSLWQHAECVQFDVSDPYRGVYICPHCWTQETPVVSEATLIVTPSSISYQWVDEIMKHLKNKALRMLVYKGVATQGYMQPRFLGNFDIVITTYETLRQELNYVDLPHSNSEMGRRFRHPKRFMATPSPLPCVEWWRVCLDEAQMVECTTTKTAEMALRLAAINRWCVTGTPVQKSVNDLQGLLMFLGVDPYGVAQWWHRCLYVPYCHHQKEPLHNLVSQYLWRNAKKDVIHQIDIPKQMEEIHWLTFTRVEEHFYQRLHAECSYDAQQRLKKFSDPKTKLSDLDRQTLSSLLHPLLKLRQACNHPQVVKGQFMSINRKTMTMEMLLDNLIKKTKLESEEAHRLLVASMNGLAGVHIIKEEWVEAVNVYRGVLQSIEEHSNIKTDSLQRLHTLHNLAELIESNHQGVAPTLRDSTLREQAEAIRKRYLQHHPQQVTAANEECTSNTEAVDELKSQYNSRIDWWLGALQSFDNDFVQEVRDEMLSSYSRFEEHKCLLYPVQSKVHMQRVLNAENDKMKEQRSDMINGVKHLLTVELTSMLDLAIDCHLRPTELEPPQCLLCATHEFFEDYEETLFSMKELKHSRTTGVSKETEDVKDKAQVLQATRRGNWGQSETERVLRYLQTRCLGKVENEIYEDSHVYFQSLEAMKKEFKNYRILWRSLFDSVSAMDEVNMATIRLRLRFPDEELPQQKKKKNGPDLDKKVEALRYVIEPAELDQQEIKLKSDQIVAKNDLRIKLGQLLYLQNLSKTDFGKEGGKNPEPCPICQGDLGEKWAVLLCGHCYCMECMRTLSNRGFNGLDKSNVKCPMCRQPTRTREISYVDTKAKEEEEYIKVQGSLSTKVEGVVRLMLKIKLSDPEAKVLVFSSWVDVLDVIADAFAQNGITFRALHQHSKFQKHLASFKSNSLISALLLPISSGANGLNIIEAAHVILVEPILNPAAELQAIGRIHRIGQTKETTVHRFLVRDTIEDRMHHILKHHHAIIHTDENTVTIEDLRNLFLHPEELELQREIALGTSQHNGTDSPQCDSQPQEGSGEGSGCRTSSGSTAASVANGSVLSALESSDSVSSPSTSKQSVSHCNSDYVTVVKASSSWLQPDEDQPSTSGHSADELSCDRSLNPDSPASEFFMCEAPERNSLQSSCTHEVDSAVLPLDSAPQEIDMSPAAPRDNTVPLSPSSSLHDR